MPGAFECEARSAGVIPRPTLGSIAGRTWSGWISGRGAASGGTSNGSPVISFQVFFWSSDIRAMTLVLVSLREGQHLGPHRLRSHCRPTGGVSCISACWSARMVLTLAVWSSVTLSFLATAGVGQGVGPALLEVDLGEPGVLLGLEHLLDLLGGIVVDRLGQLGPLGHQLLAFQPFELPNASRSSWRGPRCTEGRRPSRSGCLVELQFLLDGRVGDQVGHAAHDRRPCRRDPGPSTGLARTATIPNAIAALKHPRIVDSPVASSWRSGNRIEAPAGRRGHTGDLA